jgi:hypothetical protein
MPKASGDPAGSRYSMAHLPVEVPAPGNESPNG